MEELKSYKELEEQGLLVRLPCKVGDSVFIIVGKDISKQGIRKAEISDNGIIFKTNRLKLKSKGKYCDKCGQKLDWGEENGR